MTDRTPIRTRVLVATYAPFLVAVLLASWLMWVRANPARSGGFCANATTEFAQVLDSSSANQNGGMGLTPDVPAILAAARSIDVERLEVNTPSEIEHDVAILKATLPPSSVVSDDDLDPRVQAALARVLAAYLKHCR